VSAQRRLLHDVSHELRSPLARIQAAVGIARQQPERVAAMQERVERESTRLDTLVGELVTLARLETEATSAAGEPVDVIELPAEVCDDARFEAQASNRDLLFSFGGKSRIQGRGDRPDKTAGSHPLMDAYWQDKSARLESITVPTYAVTPTGMKPNRRRFPLTVSSVAPVDAVSATAGAIVSLPVHVLRHTNPRALARSLHAPGARSECPPSIDVLAYVVVAPSRSS
jgi:hypothetical protein